MNEHSANRSPSPIDIAIDEARELIPEAFRENNIPEFLIEHERNVITEKETKPVRTINDVISSVGDYGYRDMDNDGVIKGWMPENCAFYRSFHFYQNDWGIYVNKRCLKRLAYNLMINIKGTWEECVEYIWFMLLYHEKYHYKIDMLSLIAESCMEKAIYIPYFNYVYLPTFLSSDNYEEGLANAFAFTSLSKAPIKGNYTAKKDWLTKLFDLSPPGYNQYQNYMGFTFRETQKELVSQLLSARIHNFISRSPLQDFIINSSHKFWNLEGDNKVFLCV
jgi:hypothetical protein